MPITSLQKNQPISWTGILLHIWGWITSGAEDVTYENPRFDSVKTNDPVAIYFVHGTADRTGSFERLAQRLLHQLPENISAIHLPAFEKRATGAGIDEFAEQLLAKIIKNKHKKVILGGHSRGGVVVNYLKHYLAEKAGIEVVIEFAICSPFQGSPLALQPLTSYSKSVQQMAPNSPFLKELAEKRSASTTPLVCYGAEDDYVVPARSACIEDEKSENITRVKYSRHGHLSITSSHKVVSDMSQRIKKIYPSLKLAETKKDDENEDDFVLVEEASSPSHAYYALDEYLEFLLEQQIKTAPNKKPDEQITLLLRLQKLLAHRLDLRDTEYPESKTLGDLTQAFLDDADKNNGVKPTEVLSKPFTQKTSLPFFGQNVQIQTPRAFIENFLKTYGNILLPIPNQTNTMPPPSRTPQ